MERKKGNAHRLSRNIKLIVFINLIFLTAHSIHGQEQDTPNGKWDGQIELLYLKGVGTYENSTIQFSNDTYTFGLRATISKKIGSVSYLGVGVGLDGYHNNVRNTLPVFIAYRRSLPMLSLKSQLELKCGYSPAARTFKAGFFSEITYGIEVIKFRKSSLITSFVIKIQEIRDDEIHYIEFDSITGKINYQILVDDIFLQSIGFKVSWIL